MSTMNVKFVEPKIELVSYIYKKVGMLIELQITLDWGSMGIGQHRCYIEKGEYVWTDEQSPLPVRRFDNIETLMYEYELPKALKKSFEALVEDK